MKQNQYFDSSKHPPKSISDHISDEWSRMLKNAIDKEFVQDILGLALDNPDYIYDPNREFFIQLDSVMNNDIMGLTTTSYTAYRNDTGNDMHWNTLSFSVNERQIKLEIFNDLSSEGLNISKISIYMDNDIEKGGINNIILDRTVEHQKLFSHFLVRAENYLGRSVPEIFYDAHKSYFNSL